MQSSLLKETDFDHYLPICSDCSQANARFIIFSGRVEAAVRSVPRGAQLPLDRRGGLGGQDEARLRPAQELRRRIHAAQRPHPGGLEDCRG